MKRALLVMLDVLVLGSLTFGAASNDCPEQVFLDPNDYGVDPNDVVVDPHSGKLGLLRVEQVWVGEPVTVCFQVCDKEVTLGLQTWTDLVTFVDETSVTIAADGTVSVEMTFASIGDHPVTLVITDREYTVAGTIVCRAFEDTPPVISACGGQVP